MPRHSLYESRIFRVVGNCGTQFLHNDVQTAVEVHMRAFRPKPLPQHFACNNFAGPLQQEHEDAKRLILDLDSCPVTGKGVAFWIRLKLAESKDAQGPGQRFHIQEVGELSDDTIRRGLSLSD